MLIALLEAAQAGVGLSNLGRFILPDCWLTGGGRGKLGAKPGRRGGNSVDAAHPGVPGTPP